MELKTTIGTYINFYSERPHKFPFDIFIVFNEYQSEEECVAMFDEVEAIVKSVADNLMRDKVRDVSACTAALSEALIDYDAQIVVKNLKW